MYDMTGWSKVDCREADSIRGDHRVSPASSLTDPSGVYSSGIVFTEWWTDEKPLLRDYNYGAVKPCAHFVAISDDAAEVDA